MAEVNGRAVQRVVLSGAIGLLGGVPIIGGGIQGLVEGALGEHARGKNEEFFAMVDARLLAHSDEIKQLVEFTNPEFIASTHRLMRAAQETADDVKRERLAAALAFAGPWSDLPVDKRERMERLVAELTSREVYLLCAVADPRRWLEEHAPEAIVNYERSSTGNAMTFVNDHIIRGNSAEGDAVRSTIEDLTRRGLIVIPPGMGSSGMILESRATGLGLEFVHYLRGIGADPTHAD